MTDAQAPGTDGTQQDAGGTDSGKEFKPPATQAELNAIIAQRVDRERAKFADYNDLKAKAEQFDAAQQASKTEAEKAADRLKALEQELNATKAAAMRARIQARHGISDEDAELFLTATDEQTLTKQAERLAAREADRKKNGNRVPREGRTPQNGSSPEAEEREVAVQLFGGGD